MNAINMKCMTAVAVLMAGISCGTDEPQLRLRGKTITIYPVLSRQLDQKESAVQVGRSDSKMAGYIGVSLERWGMLPRASAVEFPIGMVEDDLTESVKKPGAFPDKPLATDYALVLLFEVKKAGGDMLVRAQAVMTDSSGRVVWAQRPGEFSSAGNTWPLDLSHQITQSLLSASDLEKTAEWPESGPFETQFRKKMEARSKKVQAAGD
jgi:hypothetical protein